MIKLHKVLDKINTFGKLNLFVFIVYIILITIIAITHELSQDEVQSWLIARDLSFIDIIKQMQYEGHSFLWHFIIAPFAKIGLPVNSQKIITSLFAISTVFIILKKAPFKNILKYMLIFSTGMIYYYSVFARPYCMIPFLLVCIATNYEKRHDHPYRYVLLVGLLAHTHLIMLPTSCLLLFFYFVEGLKLLRNKKQSKKVLFTSTIIGILLILIYLIIAFISFFNCQIVEQSLEIVSSDNLLNHSFELLKNTWMNINSKMYGINILHDNYSLVPTYFMLLNAIILFLIFISSVKSYKQGMIFWSQYLFSLLLHTFCWFLIPIRAFIIIYTLMFFLWVYRYDEQYKKNNSKNILGFISLCLLIIITLPGGIINIKEDINKEYANGETAAKYIEKNIPKGSVFVSVQKDFPQLLAGYLNKNDYKFYMVNAKRFITFNIWDEKHFYYIYDEDIKNTLKKMKNKYENVYILLADVYHNYLIHDFNLEYKYNVEVEFEYMTISNNMISGEYVYDQVYFTIYKVL